MHKPDTLKAQIIERDAGDEANPPMLVIVAPCQCECGRKFSAAVKQFSPQF